VSSWDLPSAAAGSVHDEHLVDDPRNNLQATGNVMFLVLDDQSCRDWRPHARPFVCVMLMNIT
jgi:hypothetical protein